jgi:hypothetical protein
MIDAPTDESALLARKLVEIHFKQHMKIMAAESRLQRVQTDLFSAQGLFYFFVINTFLIFTISDTILLIVFLASL